MAPNILDAPDKRQGNSVSVKCQEIDAPVNNIYNHILFREEGFLAANQELYSGMLI